MSDKLSAKDIELFLQNEGKDISTEEDLISMFEFLIKRSEKSISNSEQAIRKYILEVLVQYIDYGGDTDIFLGQRPVMPHEKHRRYYEAISAVLADILLSDYGKSTPGGTDFITMNIESCSLWKWEIVQSELTKVLKDAFGVTIIYDESRTPSTNQVEMGFSVDAKWPPAES